MKYARWATRDEMKEYLSPINLSSEVTKSGVPVMYDDENIYINNREAHTIVVGSTGCGKTQSITLPMIKMSVMAGESIVVNDVKGDLLRLTGNLLKENGYEVIELNFNNTTLGKCWNPLTLPYNLFKEGKKDKAMEMIDDLGYYLFEENEKGVDPFWVNSTINYFSGLVLYLFEHGSREEINLNSIYNLSVSMTDKKDDVSYSDILMNSLSKTSSIYMNLSGTLLAPNETRGSILSVFSQKLRRFIIREGLSNMISNTDFDYLNIGNKKVAIFIVTGKNDFTNSLVPLFITQFVNIIDMFGNKAKRINVLLDEFENLLPINNFNKLIDYSRSINIKFIVFIKSYLNLVNTYGKENYELIKICFGTIIYLLANDLFTLEEVSKMCGNQMLDNGSIMPLITVEELKLFNNFEALALIPRMYPFKTKLLPDYEIDYKYEVVDFVSEKRSINEIKLFNIADSL